MHPTARVCRTFACSALLPCLLAQSPPCFETNVGAGLGLGDDAVAANLPLGFLFPGPGGSVPAISVSSNGFVWLANNADAGCCDGSVAGFVAGQSRIAIAWTDLVPGTVSFQTSPPSGAVLGRAVVTWSGVSEFGGAGAFTAQLQLFSDGSFSLAWGNPLPIALHTTVIGVTQGNGAAANAITFSSLAGSNVYDSGTNPTVLQSFAPNALDVAGRSFLFTRNGTGGYTVREQAPCHNALFTAYGRGCPGQPTVYEQFAAGALDLQNRSLRFSPDGSGGFDVTAIATQPDLTVLQNVVTARDDDVVRNLALPFAWSYAGNATSAIDVSSNGCVYLVPNTILDSRCCEPSLNRFLAETASIAALWTDLYPPGGGAVYFDAPTGQNRCYVTWRDCPEFGNSAVRSTAQLMLEQGGAFELRYGTASAVLHGCVVGFTLGGGAPDPGSIDYTTALPFHTGPGGTPASLAAAPGSRPAIGGTCTLRVGGVPSAATFGFLLLSLNRAQPAVELSAFGMPGCFQHIDLASAVTLPLTVPASPVSASLAIPNAAGLLGTSVFAQAALDAPGANGAGLVASNGGELAVGR
jgi:hypothetical protein